MLTTEELQKVADLITANTIFCTKEVLTSDEAARYLGVSKSCLYKWTMLRLIPHYKPSGKMCYFNRKEVEAWMQSNRIATADKDIYATITLKLSRAGIHAYCENIKSDCFCTNGNLDPLVKLINDAEICNPDTRFFLTEKGEKYAE